MNIPTSASWWAHRDHERRRCTKLEAGASFRAKEQTLGWALEVGDHSMLPDARPSPGTAGHPLAPHEELPHCCPSPWGPWRRGEAGPPSRRNKLCLGFLPSLPLPFKKLHILVLCGLHPILPLQGHTFCDSHTHTPTTGSGWCQRGDRGGGAFSIRTALPLPLFVSLEWEEGTRDAMGAPTLAVAIATCWEGRPRNRHSLPGKGRAGVWGRFGGRDKRS